MKEKGQFECWYTATDGYNKFIIPRYKYRLRIAIATAIGTRMLVFAKPPMSNYAFFNLKGIPTQ